MLNRIEMLRRRKRDAAAAQLAHGETALRDARAAADAATAELDQFAEEAEQRFAEIEDASGLLRVSEEWQAYRRNIQEHKASAQREGQRVDGLRATLQREERKLRQTEKLIDRERENLADDEQRAEQSTLDDLNNRKHAHRRGTP